MTTTRRGLVAIALALAAASAAQPARLTNLNQTSAPSYSRGTTRLRFTGALGADVYLAGESSAVETSLYWFSGTGSLVPVVASVLLDHPARSLVHPTLAGSMYFLGGNGQALVRSDGTLAGTVVLAHTPGSNQFLGEVVGGRVIFCRADALAGRELWAVDGADGGVLRLADAAPGPADGCSDEPVVPGGAGYWRVPLGSNDEHLWMTDGTPAGTRQVPAFAAPGINWLGELTPFGSKLLLSVTRLSDQLPWITDGTDAGTLLLDPTARGAGSFAVNAAGTTAYFAADHLTTNVARLWKTDGTPAGTQVVSDTPRIGPGPRPLWAAGRLFFVGAADPGTDVELWSSDGASTTRVADVFPGPANSSYPADFTAVGSVLVFSADDGIHGRELWRSDGTASGTSMLADMAVGASDVNVQDTLVVGAKAYFVLTYGSSSNVHYLWETGGTAATTQLVEVFDAVPPGSSLPYEFRRGVGGRAYFLADDGISGEEVFTSDGTDAGTRLLFDVRPGTGQGANVSAENAVSVGSTFFFFGRTASPSELWRSDGANGTTQKVPLPAGVNADGWMAPFRNTLYFTAGVASSRDLWRLAPDGGEQFIKLGTPSGIQQLTTDGERLFFTGLGTSTGVELYVTDGLDAGLSPAPVKDIESGIRSSNPYLLTAVGGRLYFTATTLDAGEELWTTDGTVGGTQRVLDIEPGVEGSAPRNLTAVGNRVFFVATQMTSTGTEVWVSDGSAAGTHVVKDLRPGVEELTRPFGLTAVGGELFFWVETDAYGIELWRTDGTDVGTRLVKDIAPGSLGSARPQSSGCVPAAVGSRLYFTASDGVSGLEPWVSDGTAVGTVRVADLVPGPGSSGPLAYLASGCHLYFDAFDTSRDVEPWAMTLTDATPPVVTPLVRGTASADGGWFTSPITVTFSATDPDGPVSVVGCDPQSVAGEASAGAITCRAESCGGTTTVTFPYRVDLTPPRFSLCPTVGARVIEATSPAGALVDFAAADAGATAVDDLSPVTVTYAPPAGTFGLGPHVITASAFDEAGLAATPCVFTLEVKDSRPPNLTCPANVSLAATSTAGAVLVESALGLSLSDVADPSPSLQLSPDAGALLPVGSTLVGAVVRDASGNQSTCSIAVTVDIGPPTLTCPEKLDLVTNDPTGTSLPDDLGFSVTDPVDPRPTVTTSLAAGARVPVGTTVITVKATNGAGKEAQCSIAAVVAAPATPPRSRYAFGCGSTGGAPALMLLATLAALLRRSRRSRGITATRREAPGAANGTQTSRLDSGR